MTSSNGTTSSGNASQSKRFELPVLGPLGSLTEGTSIPAPPDSPFEEKKAPQFPNAAAATTPSTTLAGTTWTGQTPAKPTPRRPSGVRRLLSRRSMYMSYNEDSGHRIYENLGLVVTGAKRPGSPGGYSMASTTTATSSPAFARKKSGGWLRRLTGGGGVENRRGSMLHVQEEEAAAAAAAEGGNGDDTAMKVPRGPPPPKLPELNMLRAKVEQDNGNGSLGGEDMFKNIR